MKQTNRLKEINQLYFLERLYKLLKNGYPLINALELMKWDDMFMETSRLIENELIEGKLIDEAFKKAGFHSSIVSYLYFVRINGDLTTSIEKCIEMFQYRMDSIHKFKSVIRYPLFLVCLFGVLLIFLKTSILPAFMDLVQSSSQSSNTVMLSMNAIDLMLTLTFIVILVLVIHFVFWHMKKANSPIQAQIKYYNKIPIYRMILKMQTSYYFATHMGMFLKTGMSMKDVLYHMEEQKELPIISYYAELMRLELQNGFYIDGLLAQLTLIEKQIPAIFKKNHNIDDLQQDLTVYAEFVSIKMERKIKKMITLIQPLFFTVIALLIVFTYLSLMWPMFQLIQDV